VIVKDYIQGLMSVLKSDPTLTPVPEDFALKLLIVEAQGLLTKQGRTRNPFCVIESGNLEKKKEKTVSSTEIMQNTLNPVWRQHVMIDVVNLDDKINIEVWDKLKDQFLGRVLLPMYSVMKSLDKQGRIYGWYPLEKSPRHKDKYVGGELFLEISCEELVFFEGKLMG
jgi:hypothetical protein